MRINLAAVRSRCHGQKVNKKIDAYGRDADNNNNNNFFSANILEDRAQWRDKTKGLSKLVIENSA